MAGEMAQLDEGVRVRRWRRGMQAAKEFERSLRAAEGPRPAQAVAELLSVLNALEAMGRWPGPRDPVSEQRVQEVRERWARIQRRARAQAMSTHINAVMTQQLAAATARFQSEVLRLALADLGGQLRRTWSAARPASTEPVR